MKVRSQRTHYMGTSNRDNQTLQSGINSKTQNVFQRSFNKSKSLYSNKDLEKTSYQVNEQQTRVNPFAGTHNEFQTQRFDKNSVKPYKYQKMVFETGRKQFSRAPLLNKEVKEIRDQFKDKKINMHKLQQLKHSFVKNNLKRRNMQNYFQQYSNEGVLDSSGLKKIVKQYGFDINQDEAQLIFKLTQRGNKSVNNKNHLNIEDFIQLMTKEDVFYQTLQLSQSSNNREFITFKENFSRKVHQVLRNKFVNLKEAFKIYRQRNEKIGKKQFDYVMKKLDLTDLVLTETQRNNIFNDFADHSGQFNVQGLICAIAEQQNNLKKFNKTKSQFQKDLKANQQMQALNLSKKRKFDMKTLSFLEYQTQFYKARAVIEQLNKLKSKKDNTKQKQFLFNKNSLNNQVINRNDLIHLTQKTLQNNGINFQKDDYQAFSAYLNYDINGNISLSKAYYQIFQQNEKQARDRMERRVRNHVPKSQVNIINFQQSNEKTALRSIEALKSKKMNPQTRQLFKYLDKDHDGYISVNQFKQKIQSLKIMQNWQINNLAGYLKINDQGFINYRDFAQRVNQDVKELDKQLPLVRNRNSKSCYDWSDRTKTKNSMIKTFNVIQQQKATKFSAWPRNLTTQDLSLIQPPINAGMHLSQAGRFNQKRQDYGANEKMNRLAVGECRRQKIAQWNKVLKQRAQFNQQRQQQKLAARNYAMRLTKQKYEQLCHQ